MTRLIDSILNENYIDANRLFEEKMSSIAEKKLYEEKRMMQSEMFGAKSPNEVRSSANYKGRASDVLGDTSSSSSRVAPGYKALSPKGTVRPRTLDIGDRYEKALQKAKDLEARGSTGKISAVKKAYRPYRATKAVVTAVRKTAGVAKKAISGAMSGVPDMMPEETAPRPRKIKIKAISRNISRSRDSITVKRKGDRSSATLRIPKDKYNPRIHSRV